MFNLFTYVILLSKKTKIHDEKKMPKNIGAERRFATRKHPRYYKSYAVTPSNDDRSYVDSEVQSKFTGMGDYG